MPRARGVSRATTVSWLKGAGPDRVEPPAHQRRQVSRFAAPPLRPSAERNPHLTQETASDVGHPDVGHPPQPVFRPRASPTDSELIGQFNHVCRKLRAIKSAASAPKAKMTRSAKATLGRRSKLGERPKRFGEYLLFRSVITITEATAIAVIPPMNTLISKLITSSRCNYPNRPRGTRCLV